jgi:flagellar hook-length control protein FliK
MEQSIGSSGAIIINKVSSPNPVEQQNVINNEVDEETADLNSLAPFIQLLNQQITLLNPTIESIDENKNGLSKQSQILSLVKELSDINGKGAQPDFAGIGKVTLFKGEDSKNNASMLSDQLLKESNLKIIDNLSMISNATKLSAGNIADKSGLANMEALQTFSKSITENLKSALKEGNVVGEKNNQDISSDSVSAANSGMVKVSSLEDISTGRIISRIVSEIKENVSADGGRIKITLNPPSLGTLEMDVAVRNNKVEVIIIADNKDVQQALNSHLDRLKGSLQNQGLTIDRCDVLMQNNRDGYQQNYSQQTSYRDGSEKSSDNSKEKYSEELKPIMPIQLQNINRLSLNPYNISIFA